MPVALATLAFSSPAMLGFLAAAVLPWLIARRQRPPMRPVGLATTSLLLEAARRQPRWMRPPVALLPLVQTLLIVAAVVATAGPTWQHALHPEASAAHRVLVLDDSADGRASKAVIAAINAVAEAAADRRLASWQAARTSSAAMASGQLPPDTAVVIVADGVVPSPALQRRLAAWTSRGGGLVILLGSESLAAGSAPLAAWIAEAANLQLSGLRTDLKASIRSRFPSSPGLTPLPGPSIQTHAVLEPIDSLLSIGMAPPRPPPQTLLETSDSSSPLLVARRYGRGTIAVSCLPWSLPATRGFSDSAAPWSDLAAWPSFLDVVGGLLDAVAPAAESAANLQQQGKLDAGPTGIPLAGVSLLAALVFVGLEAWVSRWQRQGNGPA
ncbi:MAG: BatA domain-containing protein [Pirellulales bacterium]|nr:BatA domain-containing protein [Pirellulales bacterium]